LIELALSGKGSREPERDLFLLLNVKFCAMSIDESKFAPALMVAAEAVKGVLADPELSSHGCRAK